MPGLNLEDATPVEVHRPRQAEGLVWVAALDGRLAGFATCEPFPDALHLWELDVRREAQGRGLGRALLAAVAEGARGRGLPAVTLTTFRDVPWNGPFYARNGFRPLEPGKLNARLAEVLAHEAARGLTGRCAMRLPL